MPKGKKTFKTADKWKFTVNELDSIINCITDMKDEYAGDDEKQKEYYDKIINKLSYASGLVKSFKSNVINHDKEVKIKLVVQIEDTVSGN